MRLLTWFLNCHKEQQVVYPQCKRDFSTNERNQQLAINFATYGFMDAPDVSVTTSRNNRPTRR